MDFTIYTAGSVDFLEIMLNATAMITGSGEAEDMARIGALVGVLLLAFQAVFSNQPIGFQKPVLMLVMYAMFFGPTSTVVIEDTASRQVKVVDNIPVGPAFVGSLISTVAHRISRTMEQATSLPGMTEYGLFSSLTTMSTIRDTLRNPTSLDAFNNFGRSEGKDLPKTIESHMILCVGNPSELEVTSIEQRYRAANSIAGGVLGAMHAIRESQYTNVWDGASPDTPSWRTCRQSSEFIASAYNAIFPELMEEILLKGFATDKTQNRILNGGQLLMNAQEAVDTFAITSKSAQDYVITSVIIPSVENGRAAALQHWHGARAAVALRDSLNQQELQWAGRGDVFKHYMKPMIAFFEGLLYGITPFMAFALLLGSAGISVLGKYLILPLAIGMWMPLLSIVNAFTLWYAGAQIDPILGGYDTLSSGFAISQVQDLDHAISKALGVGGLLAASVPALALFIVSGSAYVANSIMSNMTSGDKFRSEDVVPRTQQSSPVLATTAMFTSDQTTQGVSRTGTREKTLQFSGAQEMEGAVQSARSDRDSAMTAYTKALGTGVQQALNTQEGRDFVTSLGNASISQLGLEKNSTFQESADTLRSLGITDAQIAQGVYQQQAGLNGSGKGGSSRLSLAGLLGAGWQQNETYQKMSNEQRQEAERAAAALGQSVVSSSSNSDKLEAGERFSSGATRSMGVTNTSTITESLSGARAAEEAYVTSSALRDKLSAQQPLDLKQVAQNAVAAGSHHHNSSHNDSARIAEERFFTTPESREMLARNLSSPALDGLTGNSSEHRMAAIAMTLQQQGRFGEMITSEFNPFMLSPFTGDAHGNAGLRDDSTAGAGFAQLGDEFDSRHGSGATTIANADLGDGHSGLMTRGREVLDNSTHRNGEAVDRHHTQSMEYIDDQESPDKVKLKHVSSTTPHNDAGERVQQSFNASKEMWSNEINHFLDENPTPGAAIKNIGSMAYNSLFLTDAPVTESLPNTTERTYTNPETGEQWAPPAGYPDDIPVVTPWESEKAQAEAAEKAEREAARPQRPRLQSASDEPPQQGEAADVAKRPPNIND